VSKPNTFTAPKRGACLFVKPAEAGWRSGAGRLASMELGNRLCFVPGEAGADRTICWPASCAGCCVTCSPGAVRGEPDARAVAGLSPSGGIAASFDGLWPQRARRSAAMPTRTTPVATPTGRDHAVGPSEARARSRDRSGRGAACRSALQRRSASCRRLRWESNCSPATTRSLPSAAIAALRRRWHAWQSRRCAAILSASCPERRPS
jgi:hypothetical protein